MWPAGGDGMSRADKVAAIVPARSSLFRHALVRCGWRSAWRDERSEVLLPPERPVAARKEAPATWTLGALLE